MLITTNGFFLGLCITFPWNLAESNGSPLLGLWIWSMISCWLTAQDWDKTLLSQFKCVNTCNHYAFCFLSLMSVFVNEYVCYRYNPHLYGIWTFWIGMIVVVHWYLPNSFVLTLCLEVILWWDFQIDNRKSLHIDHGSKAVKVEFETENK